MSGQEERDALFARLFGLSALLHSGLLLRPSEQTEQSQLSQKDQKDLKTFDWWLTELVAVGTKKSWLRESAGWTILETITALSTPPTSGDTTNTPSAEWTSQARGVLLDHCLGATTGGSSTSRTWTPEKVAVLLHCQERWPGYDLSSYTQGTWKHGSVLHASNFGTLAKILKASYLVL
jgi:DNA polymerase phi